MIVSSQIRYCSNTINHKLYSFSNFHALLLNSGFAWVKITGNYMTFLMMIMILMVFLVTMPILLIMTVMMMDTVMMTMIMAVLPLMVLALLMLLIFVEMSMLIRPKHFLWACMAPDNDTVSLHWPPYLLHLTFRHLLPFPLCLQAPENHYNNLISFTHKPRNKQKWVNYGKRGGLGYSFK